MMKRCIGPRLWMDELTEGNPGIGLEYNAPIHIQLKLAPVKLIENCMAAIFLSFTFDLFYEGLQPYYEFN